MARGSHHSANSSVKSTSQVIFSIPSIAYAFKSILFGQSMESGFWDGASTWVRGTDLVNHLREPFRTRVSATPAFRNGHVGAQHRIHAGLVPGALAPEPCEDVPIDTD